MNLENAVRQNRAEEILPEGGNAFTKSGQLDLWFVRAFGQFVVNIHAAVGGGSADKREKD